MKFSYKVAWDDYEGRRITSRAWDRLCAAAKARCPTKAWDDELNQILAEEKAENRPGDYLYFNSEQDLLMFVLKWA